MTNCLSIHTRDCLDDLLDVARQAVCCSKTVVDQWVIGSMPGFKAQALAAGRQSSLFFACYDVTSNFVQ